MLVILEIYYILAFASKSGENIRHSAQCKCPIFFEKDKIMNVFFDLSQAKNPQKKKKSILCPELVTNV